ncbi:family 16 glycosylhydrolase [Bradyrhizobium sp. AZCC 2289]|uniref:family 16 glycosylhydrolase n=1 Tax=Bradyrhizobium sp. AZCC 2289 TaxID=3117026 RepID=UPI002FF0BD91
MALSAPAGYTSSNLDFEENFSSSTLDSYWHSYITSNAAGGYPWNANGSGGSFGGTYNADYDMPSQVSVSNGTLDLTAIRQPVSGSFNGTAQTYPITSGVVSSYGDFEFNGGYLQISMKAPSGGGAWPALWLLPGSGAGGSGDNFEIDMQEGGMLGSGPANQTFSWHLHAGAAGTFGGVIDTGIDLTAAFHTYAINWIPGQSITWYLDGNQMAQVTSAQTTIPNEPMELIMNNGVANSNATGWHTTLDSSYPSSTQMQVDGIQLYQKAGSGETVTGANVTPTTPPTVQPAVTQATAAPATGIEHAGDTVTLTLGFNEAVSVSGTPTLSLNDGNTATYVSGSGTGTLTFRTTVASTDTNTSALAITGVNLANGASIHDASGVAANLAGAVKTFSGLQIDPVLPAVTQATASPGTGTELVGDTIALTLGFNEAVTVTGTPTLSLNDGDTATYVGGSGTSALTFSTTVASTDTSTSALAITGVNLANGASIHDASGVAANLAGAVKTFSGLQIDPPVSPPVLPAVTQATASPATGTEVVGNTITLTLGFNEAVTVTGTPTLSLNDGDTATYVGGSGTGTLTFRTTVASTDTNTSALAITGVNLANGASIHDASGVAANLAGAVKTFSGLQIATSSTSPSSPSTPPSIAPVLTVADSTLSVAGRGGTVGLGVNVTTTDPNDAVTVNITGLPKYETITDKLDGRTFRGNNVTLTAAEVDSGLVLQSNYRGGGHPVATLTLTATGKDPSTGAVTTSASQTITVTDPRPATATTTTSPHTTAVTNPAPATDTTTTSPQTINVTNPAPATDAITASPQTISLTNPAPATDTTTAFPAGKGFAWLSQDQAASNAATTEPQAIAAKNPSPATIGSLANQGFALLQQHLDGVTGAAPISVPQTFAETDSAPATGKAMASLASQSFALLNQYMAGNTGRVDPGQIVAAVSQGAGWGQDSLLTRPQH